MIQKERREKMGEREREREREREKKRERGVDPRFIARV